MSLAYVKRLHVCTWVSYNELNAYKIGVTKYRKKIRYYNKLSNKFLHIILP